MGIYKYIRDAWKTPKETLGQIQKDRLILWRSEPVTIRIEHPTRLDAARASGFKAKQGIILVRQRVDRGGRQKPKIKGGRRPKHSSRRKDLKMSYQVVAEQRSSVRYPNMEVLNSYFVGKDGESYWFEVILVDRSHPAILADKQLSQIAGQKSRVHRGRTSAARQSLVKLSHDP